MPSLKIRLLFIFSTILYLFSSTVIPTFANISYTYDADGNMTSDSQYCYSYNEENQLVQVKNCGNNQIIAQYVYDYQGNRLIKKNYVNGTLNTIVYSPEDEYETRKIASNGATQNTTYYFANNQQIAKKNPDGSKTYVHNDDLGSSSVLTNQSGAIAETTTYDPWGEVKSGGTKDKFQYTGQEKDSETGLNYYNSRYYNPHIRRFVQPDTMLPDVYNPQALNRYSYVNNNPLRYTDPSGHFIIELLQDIWESAQPYIETSLSKLTQLIPRVTNTITSLVTKVTNSQSASTITNVIQKTQSNPVVQNVENNVSKQSPAISNNENTVLRGAQNPVVQKAIEYGKQMHAEQEYPIGYTKEVTLESGKRVDALNETLRHIIELKPDTEEAISKGMKQLNQYLEEINQSTKAEWAGGGWTGEVWTYPKQ